ncbi:SIR2 family protein [Psychrobacter sp. B38]|uniref:SIR2 family protein n=1 Tax=Psychrobacter sp. B38 TaxID=3143538 RepID=UPI00320F168B
MSEQSIENKLAEILSESPSAPFLFIGSGFSRRYIDLPDWIGLLKKFSKKPFASYLGKANNNIPLAALELAHDYHQEWFADFVGKEDIYDAPNWSNKIETPLKYEIAKYLREFCIGEDVLNNHELIELANEKVVIDGIITTNWDLLLENIFPTFKSYIGQSDILFKHPHDVCEIFKIHGCCTKFNSLVLSSTDYESFNDKNPYLSAKLISIFLEKPIIFIGYSISDENITDILEKIDSVIDTPERRDKLAKNMIFVTRANGKKAEITKIIKTINDKRLDFTSVVTDDFGQVYRALQHTERRIPVEFLRIFKEEIYNIVNSKDKADLRLKAIDFDSILEGDDIEFVAGVGVASSSNFGKRGLFGINVDDLIKDIIFNDIPCSKKEVDVLIPSLVGRTTYIPIRKYIDNNNYDLATLPKGNLKKRLNMSAQCFADKIQGRGNILQNIAQISDPKSIIQMYPNNFDRIFNALGLWLNSNQTPDNCELVRDLIKDNYTTWFEKGNNSYFRRLICILDEVENN